MGIYTCVQFKDLLKKRLSPKRYHHSLMVEKEALKLAVHHKDDWYRARIAGLLHDICREDRMNDQREYMERFGYIFSDAWLKNPQIWHGVCGSLYLKHELGISDRKILQAVKNHTTGCANMSRLEQIVFIADATSEDRDYPKVELVRKAALVSLDEAMFICLSNIVEGVARCGLPLVRESFQAYNEYSSKKRIGARI